MAKTGIEIRNTVNLSGKRTGVCRLFRGLFPLVILVFAPAQPHAAAEAERPGATDERAPIKALYMPLADHYAGVLAHSLFADEMTHAAYAVERMTNWYLLRAAFREGRADMAFIICPDALDMFAHKPDFRWVGLLHRDGNQLIANNDLADRMDLAESMVERLPDSGVADALRREIEQGHPVSVGLPHPRATHSVILYKYLRDHGLSLGMGRIHFGADVMAEEVVPHKSLFFLNREDHENIPSCTQQSLPWGAMAEQRGLGKIVWTSRDVLPWPGGHVECIVIASDKALREKPEAVKEVLRSIQRAGLVLEEAREEKGTLLHDLAGRLRHYMPEHTEAGIREALDPVHAAISYKRLIVDQNAIGSLREIMNLALEAGILDKPVDLEALALKTDEFPEAAQ